MPWHRSAPVVTTEGRILQTGPPEGEYTPYNAFMQIDHYLPPICFWNSMCVFSGGVRRPAPPALDSILQLYRGELTESNVYMILAGDFEQSETKSILAVHLQSPSDHYGL